MKECGSWTASAARLTLGFCVSLSYCFSLPVEGMSQLGQKGELEFSNLVESSSPVMQMGELSGRGCKET